MALSVPTPRVLRNADAYKFADVIVNTSDVIYPGALCCVVAATGKLTPAADSTTLRFAGVAIGNNGDMQTVTGDGTLKCRVIISDAEILITCAGTVDAGDLFTDIYCTDDASVTDVATLGPVCGMVTEIEDSTHAWVLIRGKAMALGT
jgi:hypothetical protein